jgi:hypothetical protein
MLNTNVMKRQKSRHIQHVEARPLERLVASHSNTMASNIHHAQVWGVMSHGALLTRAAVRGLIAIVMIALCIPREETCQSIQRIALRKDVSGLERSVGIHPQIILLGIALSALIGI